MKSASSALRHFKANAIQIRDSARIEQTLSERLDCFSSAYVSSPDTARNGTLPYTILTNPVCTQVHTMDATAIGEASDLGFTCDRGTVTRCHLAL